MELQPAAGHRERPSVRRPAPTHPVYEGPYSGVVRLLFSCCGDGMRRSSRRGAEVGLPGRHVVKMPEVMCTTRAWLSAGDVGRRSVD